MFGFLQRWYLRNARPLDLMVQLNPLSPPPGSVIHWPGTSEKLIPIEYVSVDPFVFGNAMHPGRGYRIIERPKPPPNIEWPPR